MLFIQANIEAPWIMLDFPTLDRFINEIKTIQYDIIGIGSITINVLKVKKMCELVRQYQPDATIVAGGHVANLPELDQLRQRFVRLKRSRAWITAQVVCAC